MSSTKLAAAYDAGFNTSYSFQNSWGSAAFIWDKLSDRYEIQGGLMDRWPALWKYHENNKLEPFEHNTLVITYDRTVVKRDDMLVVATSLAEFVRRYPPDNRVCTLLAQSACIHEAYENGAEFLAWTHTTVCDDWWQHPDKGASYDPHFMTHHTVADIQSLPEDAAGEDARLRTLVFAALDTATKENGYDNLLRWTPRLIAEDLTDFAPSPTLTQTDPAILEPLVVEWLSLNRK